MHAVLFASTYVHWRDWHAHALAVPPPSSASTSFFAPYQSISLSYVNILLGEWIPMGANNIVALNDRLGSFDRCQAPPSRHILHTQYRASGPDPPQSLVR